MQGCPMCARMSNKRELRGLYTKVDINHYGQAGKTQFLPLLDEIKVLTLLTFSKIGKRHTHQLNFDTCTYRPQLCKLHCSLNLYRLPHIKDA